MLTATITQMYKMRDDVIKGACKKALTEAAFDGQAYAVRALEARDVWDRGDLSGSIEVDLSKLDRLMARIWTNAPHAAVIEFGAGPRGEKPTPGWYPPHKVILHWVQRRLGLSGKEAEQATWAIKHAIHERGFAPKPYMRPAQYHTERMFAYYLKEKLGESFRAPEGKVRAKMTKEVK